MNDGDDGDDEDDEDDEDDDDGDDDETHSLSFLFDNASAACLVRKTLALVSSSFFC